MIANEYESSLKEKLNLAQYLLLILVVGCLQKLQDMRLERIAEALPIPILMESRRKKIQRFLSLAILTIEEIWFPCLKEFLKKSEKYSKSGWIYLAIDRTNWGAINLLTVSLIYDKIAVLLYWEFLDNKGNSSLKAQQRVIEKAISLFEKGKIVILGDREFCSVTLGKWLGQKGMYFCLRQKKTTNIAEDNQFYREMRTLGLAPGTSLFLNDVKITKIKGFGEFNLACKWKKTYRGFKTKEPWFILTNLGNVEEAIKSYQKRFGIEEMFRDLKSGGYNLEGTNLEKGRLSKLLIIVAIAHTSGILQGETIKKKGIQKYIVRPKSKRTSKRRHSSFYVGQHLHLWVGLQQIYEKTIQELMQISRHRLKNYVVGKRAIELAISVF
ncbi:MAG: IS4 family transposase [Snowella sp.]